MSQTNDRLLKSLAEDDPRALYHLARRPLPPPEAEIVPMVQEVPPRMGRMDYWFRVKAGDEEWADIFEFKGRYESSMNPQVLDYALRAHLETHLPVNAVLIVTSPGGFPRSYRTIEPVVRPGLVSIHFETVRLWEIDASVALDSGRQSLLPLVPFMRTGMDQLIAAARSLRAAEEGARQWFLKSVAMKYPEDVVARMRQEVSVTNEIMERILREAFPVSPVGMAQRVEGVVSSIQVLVEERFPQVEVPSAVLEIRDPDALSMLFRRLIRANSEEEARVILQTASAIRENT